jgi:hypothetical protein
MTEKILQSIRERFMPSDTYAEALEKAKEITKEFAFFSKVQQCSELVFWKSFEHGRKLIQTDKFEKQLYTSIFITEKKMVCTTKVKLHIFYLWSLPKGAPHLPKLRPLKSQTIDFCTLNL